MLFALRLDSERILKLDAFAASPFRASILLQARELKKQILEAALHNNATRQLDQMSARGNCGQMQNVLNVPARESRVIALKFSKDSADQARSQRRQGRTTSVHACTQIEWP